MTKCFSIHYAWNILCSKEFDKQKFVQEPVVTQAALIETEKDLTLVGKPDKAASFAYSFLRRKDFIVEIKQKKDDITELVLTEKGIAWRDHGKKEDFLKLMAVDKESKKHRTKARKSKNKKTSSKTIIKSVPSQDEQVAAPVLTVSEQPINSIDSIPMETLINNVQALPSWKVAALRDFLKDK